MINPEADCLFEVSWEVCNKVGGIHTVLASKVKHMQAHYKNYYLIGPYYENNSGMEFSHQSTPAELKSIFDDLGREGIKCYYGVWEEVQGSPKVILIDFSGIIWMKNEIKEAYWNDYKIDSLRGYWDFEEPSLWSYAVGKLIERMKTRWLVNSKVVAHFHEWLTGFGLLYLKKNCKSVATVFTTHATVLGRTLASNNVDLYSLLNTIDPLAESYRFTVEAKHLTEKAAALHSDVFTTVSEITGLEAEKFLGRKPDILLYNGLDASQFPSFEDISIKHRISRDKIREFLTYYFFPYYTFEMEKNLIFFTLGRYEYRDKGFDIIIKSLGRLNERLKSEAGNPPVANVASNTTANVSVNANVNINANVNADADVNHTITVLFWIPMEHHGLKIEVLENKNYYMHIKNYVTTNGSEILTRMIYDTLSRKDTPERDLVSKTFLSHLHKDLVAFERKGNPPFSTHNIDELNNSLIVAFRQNNLLNRKEDFVKVIVEPVYLDGNDGFIDLTYYDSIIGCHLGLFPSYYEPWGYTPLESVALGVPALTTDLSGFGRFIKNHDARKDGVYLLERLNQSDDSIIGKFSDMMYKFLKYNLQERIDCKLNAKNFSNMADWKIFVEYYIDAHNTALRKVYSSLPK
jgi:glycogen(starch) synthase